MCALPTIEGVYRIMMSYAKTTQNLLYLLLIPICMLSSIAFAAPGDVALSGAPTNAALGGEFDVILSLDVGTLRYQSSTLVFEFPPTLLELKSIQTETSPVLTSTRPGFSAPPTSGLNGTGVFAIRGAETSFSLTGSIALHRLTFRVLDTASVGSSAEIGIVPGDSRNSIFGRPNETSPGEEILLGSTASVAVLIGPTAGPCTAAVTGGSTSVPAEGGTTSAFNVDVTGTDCRWTVVTDVGTTSVPGGSGDGTFTVTVPENNTGAARTIEVVVVPEGNTGGAETVEITQPPYGRELLDRTILYGDCWQRSGLVQVPGATRLRLVLESLSIELCCDVLTVFGDETEEYRGEAGGPFRTAFVTGNTIELVMASNSYLGGQFTVVAVEYEGVATGSASLSGELFEGAEDGDCPGTFFLGSTYSANPEDGTFSGAYVGKESGEISFYVISLDAPVTWNISTFSGCEFMSVEPSSGISSPGEPSQVVVSYDANTTGEARYCAFSIDSGESDQHDAFLDQGTLELIQTIAQRLILYLGELDTDGDNQLSPEEADIAPDDFDGLDRNSDGFLASRELEKVAYPGTSCSGEVGASPSGLKSDLVLLFLTIGGLILSGKSIGGRRIT